MNQHMPKLFVALRLVPAASLILLAAVAAACASTPPYQGLTTDQLFELGAREFEEKDWDEAVRVFERFLSAESSSPRAVEARMYLARAYFNRKEYLTAATEFGRIVERHPGHPLAPEASLGICQSYAALSPHVQRDQSYTEQAVRACGNTLMDFPAHPVAAQAREIRDSMVEKLAEKLYIAGDFYFRRKLYHSAILYFGHVLRDYPRTKAAPKALLRTYQAYLALDWDREAQETRERLLREYPESPEARSLRSEGG